MRRQWQNSGIAIMVTIFSLVVSSATTAQQTAKDEQATNRIIRIPQVAAGTEPLYRYVKTLLQMALDSNADKYGKVELRADAEEAVQERQLRSLEHRQLDVTWSVTTAERESLYHAIRIPLVAGLFGHRLLLIQRDDPRFDSPVPLNTLKQYRAVQGQDWPDTRVYRHHGFSVLESTYKATFNVLSGGFADYYPRGILEVDYELDYVSALPIALEKHLLIRYPSAMYFFVGRDNPALAKRIEEGLITLIENGKFQSLLQSQAFFQASETHAAGRTVIELANPMLSDASRQALATYLPYFNPPQ